MISNVHKSWPFNPPLVQCHRLSAYPRAKHDLKCFLDDLNCLSRCQMQFPLLVLLLFWIMEFCSVTVSLRLYFDSTFDSIMVTFGFWLFLLHKLCYLEFKHISLNVGCWGHCHLDWCCCCCMEFNTFTYWVCCSSYFFIHTKISYNFLHV